MSKVHLVFLLLVLPFGYDKFYDCSINIQQQTGLVVFAARAQSSARKARRRKIVLHPNYQQLHVDLKKKSIIFLILLTYEMG